MSPRSHESIAWMKVSPLASTFKALVDEQLTGKLDPDITPPSIRLKGQCFTCFGEVESTWPLQLLPTGYDSEIVGQGRGTGIYVDVVLKCNCGHHHPGAARNVLGCGRTFKIGVPCD